MTYGRIWQRPFVQAAAAALCKLRRMTGPLASAAGIADRGPLA